MQDSVYIQNQEFKAVDFNESLLQAGDYESCTFTNCLFTSTLLAKINFINCHFESCDWSMAQLVQVAFREVEFVNNKFVGTSFEAVNPFLLLMKFKACHFQLSSFVGLAMPETKFENCRLQEVDFSESDLTKSQIIESDLSGCIFKNTILEAADLQSAFHFSIDPSQNKIKGARFSASNLSGLLDKYEIEIE